MGMSERHTLLHKIGMISFTMDDLRLFLDTHPDCSMALTRFNELAKERELLVAEYNEACGPMNFYNSNECNQAWRWVDEPWPWEGEC